MEREKPRGIKEERELAILKRRRENAPSALKASLIAVKTNAVLNLTGSIAEGIEARKSSVFNLTSSRAADKEGRNR
jgi:hypothetical protein